MKCLHKILIFSSFIALASCTEAIVIDIEEGNPLIGVEASFTDEMKHHEAILSYTADFYNQNDIHMVSGATVYVTDGVDTVYYHEDDTLKGHYFTDLVAGRKNTLYRFCADVADQDGEMIHLYAESLMPDNVESVDSLVIKHFNGGNDSIPSTFFGDTIEWMYPYFQSLPDPSIVYMPLITKNDTLLNDTLTERMVIPVGGYAGYYINGPEMQEANKEIPISYFRRSKLNDGDCFKVDIYSIPQDYLVFVYSVMMSTGSNPMMGAPANVSSNIQPAGEAVGWFYAASVVSSETVFRK